MLKRNKMIQNNRKEIQDFCDNINNLFNKTKYLPLSAREESQKALTELHDFIAYLDPTCEAVAQTVHRLYPMIEQITMELEHLTDIESDTAESLTAIIRNYI